MMARLFGHELIEELAEHATVPVINGLTDLLHPCQVMADQFTIIKKKGEGQRLKTAYIGDGNNVTNSWLNLASRLGMQLSVACPEGYDPDAEVLERAQQTGVSEIQVLRDPYDAVQSADVIYTDVWASMGQEAETEARKIAFRDFQVNLELLKSAKPDCLVMHCLPAHRGDEITDEVIDGPNSVVFDEAENRLHVQKAVMVTLFG
jgi:ornithine carbamoyltransferase